MLSIQPLVHNSIIHGIIPSGKAGVVEVIVERKGENIRILVTDDGVGMKEAELGTIFVPGKRKGLRNRNFQRR